MKNRSLFIGILFCAYIGIPNTLKAQSINSASFNDIENSARRMASSAKSVAKKAMANISSSTTNNAVDNMKLAGLWNFNGTACKFKSDNLFKKAGGVIAAKAVESELNGKCQEVGITKEKSSFEFKNGNSFITRWENHTMTGTYTYNEAKKTVSLKYNILLGMDATVKLNGNKMVLLFDADTLLKLFTFMGGLSGDATIRTAAKFAKSYDGMLVGFDLKK